MARTAVLAAWLAALAAAVPTRNTPPAPYEDRRLPAEERARDLLGRMTPAEKARMLSGSGWMESAPIERLGIPAIKMADGPLGVRNWRGSSAITNAPTTVPVLATAFPASIGMALLIGGGVWFVVSWAVATAASDVERDSEEAGQTQTVLEAAPPEDANPQ